MILEVTNQGTQIVNDTLGQSLEVSGMELLDHESQQTFKPEMHSVLLPKKRAIEVVANIKKN